MLTNRYLIIILYLALVGESLYTLNLSRKVNQTTLAYTNLQNIAIKQENKIQELRSALTAQLKLNMIVDKITLKGDKDAKR